MWYVFNFDIGFKPPDLSLENINIMLQLTMWEKPYDLQFDEPIVKTDLSWSKISIYEKDWVYPNLLSAYLIIENLIILL